MTDTRPAVPEPGSARLPRSVAISMGDAGSGQVLLDGHDISRAVSGFTLEYDGGMGMPVPRLTLRAHPHPTLYEGPALVELADPAGPLPEPDYYGVLLDWLDTIDPVDLSRRALNGAGMGQDPIAAALDALKDEARKARGEH